MQLWVLKADILWALSPWRVVSDCRWIFEWSSPNKPRFCSTEKSYIMHVPCISNLSDHKPVNQELQWCAQSKRFVIWRTIALCLFNSMVHTLECVSCLKNIKRKSNRYKYIKHKVIHHDQAGMPCLFVTVWAGPSQCSLCGNPLAACSEKPFHIFQLFFSKQYLELKMEYEWDWPQPSALRDKSSRLEVV